MAQFATATTIQGRLKSLRCVDSFRCDTKEPFHYNKLLLLGNGGSSSIQLHKPKFELLGSTRIYSSSSSYSSSSPSKNQFKHFDAKVLVNGNDIELDTDELSCFRGLVLDLSYRPVNIVGWKRAICLEFMEKADVLEYYEKTVNSPNGSYYIPAVLRVQQLLRIVKRKRFRRVASRKDILRRDDFTCQYCSSLDHLTIDHVLPISRGGEWKWENLVTACNKCNIKKGSKTLEEANMKLIKVPKAPKDSYDVFAVPLTKDALKRLKKRMETPEEWRQYLR